MSVRGSNDNRRVGPLVDVADLAIAGAGEGQRPHELPAVRLELASVYNALDGDLKEAARRDLALITVGEALLSPDSVVI